MLRMKYVTSLAVVLTAGVLWANVGRGDEQPGATTVGWDDGGPIGQVAFLQDDDRGPLPDARGPGRGPGMGAGRMQGPPPGGRGDGPGRGMGPGQGMGPGMNPNCPVGGMGMGGFGGMRNDPEMNELFRKDWKLSRESRQLAAKYQNAATDEREAIKKELEELVNKQFDVRQERRNLELKRLEENLQRLRDAVEGREKVRKELIEKRVSDLLGMDKELDF